MSNKHEVGKAFFCTGMYDNTVIYYDIELYAAIANLNNKDLLHLQNNFNLTKDVTETY